CLRGDRRRFTARRDHHGLGERQAEDAAGRQGTRGGGHPLRGPGDERAPDARPRRRVLQGRADEGAEGDHRRSGDERGAPRRRRRPHEPAGDRRPDRRQEPRRHGRAARDRADAARRAGRVHGRRRRQERRALRGADHRALISRYTREEIGAVWTQRRKMEGWLEVELAVTDALAGAGVVPHDDAAACRGRGSFTVEAVEERERTTNHDVAAFVDVVAASIGPEGRWIHYGLTSSDVLDTALATQIRAAGEIVVPGAIAYRDALIERALEHRDTVCVGRTHGIHAEPTSFGLRLAGFAFEAEIGRA